MEKRRGSGILKNVENIIKRTLSKREEKMLGKKKKNAKKSGGKLIVERIKNIIGNLPSIIENRVERERKSKRKYKRMG